MVEENFWWISYVTTYKKWINNLYIPTHSFNSTVSQDHPFKWLKDYSKIAAANDKRLSLISYQIITRDEYHLFSSELLTNGQNPEPSVATGDAILTDDDKQK